jgi:hypothetical protein
MNDSFPLFIFSFPFPVSNGTFPKIFTSCTFHFHILISCVHDLGIYDRSQKDKTCPRVQGEHRGSKLGHACPKEENNNKESVDGM